MIGWAGLRHKDSDPSAILNLYYRLAFDGSARDSVSPSLWPGPGPSTDPSGDGVMVDAARPDGRRAERAGLLSAACVDVATSRKA